MVTVEGKTKTANGRLLLYSDSVGRVMRGVSDLLDGCLAPRNNLSETDERGTDGELRSFVFLYWVNTWGIPTYLQGRKI